MALDFLIPTSGGTYALPQTALDFWQRDLVDAPPVVESAEFSVNEDVALTTVVGTVEGEDADAGDVLTWSITGGNVGGAFSIHPSTGVLKVAAALDYHERASYTLTVRATDTTSLYGEASITITVLSTGPVVMPATFEVGEFATPGTVVGLVDAEDPQGDPDLVFAIAAGNTDNVFAIGAETGQITVAAALDYETKDQYQLTIKVTDSTGRWNTATITVDILNQVEPYLPPAPALIHGLNLRWAQSAKALNAMAGVSWRSAQALDLQRMASWTQLRTLDADARLRWASQRPLDASRWLEWKGRQKPLDREAALRWGSHQVMDVQRGLDWKGRQKALDVDASLRWNSYRPLDTEVAIVFTRFDDHAPAGEWYTVAPPIQPGTDIEVRWSGFDFNALLTDDYPLPQAALDFIEPADLPDLGGMPMPVDVRWLRTFAPTWRPHAVDALQRLPWVRGRALDGGFGLRSGSTTELPPLPVDLPWNNDPPDFEQIVIPPLKVYNTMNNVSVVRLPERTPINPIGLSLDYDDSNFCWSGTLVLFSEAEAALLKPSPVNRREIEVSVNGFVVVLTIQTRARERKFPSKRWTLQAAGRQVYLAEPYSRPRSLISTTLKSAAQLAIDELPPGWTLTWLAPDWNIPAGMWSYSGLTPIKAIARLAEAVGAVLEPDPEDQKIVVRSRYPVSPTQWHAVMPDVTLPDDVCVSMGDTDRPAETRNQVIVQATRAPGVRVVCTRTGTGGDDPLPSVTEDLCTSVICGTERGRVELDATGPSSDQSIALPILPASGVILPGKLIEVTEGANDWRGLGRGVAITAQRLENGWGVGQTLSIERRETT